MAVYIRDGGSGSGTSWSDALDQIPSTLSRGETYYIADGSYSAPTLDDAVSGSTFITIKKATIADHGTNTGWNDAYGDGVATFSGTFSVHTSYWIIDGVVGGGPSSWTSGHGFKINGIFKDIGPGFDSGVPGGSYVTLSHVDIEGTYTPGNDDAISFDRCSNCTVSYVYTHETDNCPMNLFVCTDMTWEYCYHGRFAGSEEFHSEIVFLYSSSGITIRYNMFRWATSTGGIMCHTGSSTAGVFVYGNVFYRTAGDAWSYGGDGLVGTWTNRADLECNNLKVYNNTFVNIISNAAGPIGTTPHTGLEWINNYFYECDGGTGLPNAAWSHNYNQYQDSGSESEANGTTGTGDPFVDYLNLNFALEANTTAGTDLGSPYNVDMLGNTRTTWTRGALEFEDPEPPAPSAPTVTRLRRSVRMIVRG